MFTKRRKQILLCTCSANIAGFSILSFVNSKQFIAEGELSPSRYFTDRPCITWHDYIQVIIMRVSPVHLAHILRPTSSFLFFLAHCSFLSLFCHPDYFSLAFSLSPCPSFLFFLSHASLSLCCLRDLFLSQPFISLSSWLSSPSLVFLTQPQSAEIFRILFFFWLLVDLRHREVTVRSLVYTVCASWFANSMLECFYLYLEVFLKSCHHHLHCLCISASSCLLFVLSFTPSNKKKNGSGLTSLDSNVPLARS